METDKKERATFNGTTRSLQESDLAHIKPILETWIKDRDTGEQLPGEVQEDLDLMRESISGGNNRTYLVAETQEGKVIGVIGYKIPDRRLLKFVKTKNPAELVNAYVGSAYREGLGVGKKLVHGLEERARSNGFTEIILNSGPRYKDTAWGFYTKIYGEPVAIAEKYYGDGGDAPVWRKDL